MVHCLTNNSKKCKGLPRTTLSTYAAEDFDYYFTSAQSGPWKSATATKQSCHKQLRPISAGQVQVIFEKGMLLQNRAVGFISQGRSKRGKMLKTVQKKDQQAIIRNNGNIFYSIHKIRTYRLHRIEATMSKNN